MKTLLTAIAVAAFTSTGASAAIVSVTGQVMEISRPAVINNDTPSNDETALAFNELQNVMLTEALMTDQGLISAGTRINSHMVLYNLDQDPGPRGAKGTVTFQNTVLGTMSDQDGVLLAMSDWLGAPSEYEQRGWRGIEENDVLNIIAPNSIFFKFGVIQPGDWARVITAAPAPVPLPAAGLLLIAGLGAIGVAARKKAA